MTQFKTQTFYRFAFGLAGILWAMAFLSCETDKPFEEVVKVKYEDDSDTPLVSYLLNTEDVGSQDFNDQIRKAVNYTKIPYKQLIFEDFNRSPVIPSTTRVLVLKNTAGLNRKAMDSIISFVMRGNSLFFTNAPQDSNDGFLSGVKRNASYEIDVAAQGFLLKENFIPGMKDIAYNNNVVHFGLKAANYLPTTETLATAVNDLDFPAIIRNRMGNGQVITINNSNFALKQNRGLYFAAILNGLDLVPYPVANVASIFLDDFPSPLYPGIFDPIKTELNKSQADFYLTIWWPDMVKLAEKHNLKYTAIPAFDYRGKTEPPFLFPEWNASKATIDGQEVIATNWLMKSVSQEKHELGFHGYNHQSLVKEEWPQQEMMEISLESAVKKWKASGLGDLPVTYVPPSNYIDSMGIDALNVAMPSLEIMSSIYLGSFEDGGDREYDPEPYNDTFYDFPRVTSGYVFYEQSIFNHQSTFLYTGIWSHFIHPDDAYQIPLDRNSSSKGDFEYRNKMSLGWRKSGDGSSGLYPRFESYIQKTQTQYPLLRFETTQEAVDRTKEWRNSSYSYNSSDKSIKAISDAPSDQYWMMFVKDPQYADIEKQLNDKNLLFSKIPLSDGYLYNIKTGSSGIQLSRPEVKLEKSMASIPQVLKEFTEYISGEPIFTTIDEEIEYYVAAGALEKAVDRVKYKIQTNPSYQESDWTALKTYLGFSEKEFALWPFLEKMYQKTQDDQLISLSRKLIKNSDYPDLETRKTWMQRQMKLYPDDTQLRQNYGYYFSEEKIKNLTPEKALIELYGEKDSNAKLELLNYLLERDVSKAHTYLAQKTACIDKDLLPFADRIAWSYADQEKYKKALAWSKCSKIEESIIAEWRIRTGEFEFLKESDYAAFINYLLINDPPRALKELSDETPCKDEKLIPLSSDISYAYSNIGAYRKALEWSRCSETIPAIDRLRWIFELRDYDKLQEEFIVYNLKHPEDTAAIDIMIEAALTQSNVVEAFKYYLKLPEEDQELRSKRMQELISYASAIQKQQILDTYGDSLSEPMKEQLIKELRLQKENTIETQSNLVTDRFSPTQLNNALFYGRRDKKGNKHQFGITQTNAYSIPTQADDPANRDFNLTGARFSFIKAERPEKLNYNLGATLEYASGENKLFYRVDAGVSLAIDSLYNSLQISHEPAITGPSFALDIYRTQASLYEELQLKNRLNIVLAIEGNRFTDGGIDGTLVTKLGYKIKLSDHSDFSPFLEGSGMLGNRDNRDGFPYWTIEERLYGGGGLSYQYKNPENKIEAQLNTAAFFDTFSDSFLRYGGALNYPVSDYFTVKAAAEFFTIKNFYSNNFSLGLKYYLK